MPSFIYFFAGCHNISLLFEQMFSSDLALPKIFHTRRVYATRVPRAPGSGDHHCCLASSLKKIDDSLTERFLFAGGQVYAALIRT
jgi:hypothetical protein